MNKMLECLYDNTIEKLHFPADVTIEKIRDKIDRPESLGSLVELAKLIGLGKDELNEKTGIAKITIYDNFENKYDSLISLGYVQKVTINNNRRGRPAVKYMLTPEGLSFLTE
ncbi:MAG: hypothetical protein GON13_00335 [Nanoarchaeota archaeon]|nr:hypothetical protein [Nanoarchaeota archaeon]